MPSLALYHSPSCFYCIRVRRHLEGLALHVELRDTRASAAHREDLIRGGGKSQVPCLLIEEPGGRPRWLYESIDIIRYLDGLAATAARV